MTTIAWLLLIGVIVQLPCTFICIFALKSGLDRRYTNKVFKDEQGVKRGRWSNPDGKDMYNMQ